MDENTMNGASSKALFKCLVPAAMLALVSFSLDCTTPGRAGHMGAHTSSPSVQTADEPTSTLDDPANLLVHVPVDFLNGLIWLEVEVNSEGPFWFIFDTGSSAAVTIDCTLAERLHLERVGTALCGDGTGLTIEKPLVCIDNVSDSSCASLLGQT